MLRGAGYQRLTLPRSLDLNSRQSQVFSDYEKDITYIHSQKRIKLELHFKLFLSNKTFPVSIRNFYLNKSEIQIGSATIPIMSKTDHHAYLLAHGAFSPWSRLKWVCDIPLISNNGKDYLSEDFIKQAKFLGIERMVIQGLCLSNELLNMPISNEIKQYKQKNKGIIRFAKKYC